MTRAARARPIRHGMVRRIVGPALLALLTASLAGCSGGDDDATGDDASGVTGTVAVDEDFPGDALDATCARLESATGDDREAKALALLDELIALGDAERAVNTMELAVVDRCPDWADAVAAAVAART